MASSSHDDDGLQVSEASVMEPDEGPQEIEPHDVTDGDPSDASRHDEDGEVGPIAAPKRDNSDGTV